MIFRGYLTLCSGNTHGGAWDRGPRDPIGISYIQGKYQGKDLYCFSGSWNLFFVHFIPFSFHGKTLSDLRDSLSPLLPSISECLGG